MFLPTFACMTSLLHVVSQRTLIEQLYAKDGHWRVGANPRLRVAVSETSPDLLPNHQDTAAKHSSQAF